MAKMYILVLPLLVLSAVEADLRADRYVYSYQYVTWSDARAYCREHHTDLITIRDEKENQYIYFVNGWLGLYRDSSTSPWKWSRGDQLANFTTWEPNEPQANEHCVFKISTQTAWRNRQCTDKDIITCFNENLILVKEKKTWEDALEHCRSLEVRDPTAYNSHRFDLVTLLTPDDHDYAREKTQEANTDVVWTGLRFLAGQWMWVGGERLQYSIHDCPADNLCGVLEKNGTARFNTRHCTDKYNFLCYRRP